MINTKFEVYKLKRTLKRAGKKFEVYRNELNEFKESSGSAVLITTIDGLYHEQSSYITLNTSDAAKVTSKYIPMILTLFDEETSKISLGDFLFIDKKKYKVIEKKDIQLWNLIYDISLEVVEDGNQV